MTVPTITSSTGAVPVAVTVLAGERLLEVEWDDGIRARFAHTMLRRLCRCAECERARRLGEEAVPAPDVVLTDVRPSGAGALQFVFSDGHARGIFPFSYLHTLAMAPQTLR